MVREKEVVESDDTGGGEVEPRRPGVEEARDAGEEERGRLDKEGGDAVDEELLVVRHEGE